MFVQHIRPGILSTSTTSQADTSDLLNKIMQVGLLLLLLLLLLIGEIESLLREGRMIQRRLSKSNKNDPPNKACIFCKAGHGGPD